MEKTILLNDRWQFAKSGLDCQDFKGLEFSPVDLPHDWLIYDSTDLYENSIGWYKRYWDYNTKKRVFLYFEGVYMDCSLYVNGTWIGDWKNGYTSFEFELTEALKPGANEILLKVVHQSPNSRWYSGAGIYRDVWLKLREADYIVTDGVYLSTRRLDDKGGRWEVAVESEVQLGSGQPLELVQTILAGEKVIASSKQLLAADEGICLDRQTLQVEGVELWSPASPTLYQLVTSLRNPQSGDVVDELNYKIGFKDVAFDPNHGLSVNGQKLKLQGVCEHHDLGALGAAFNKNALKRRLELLKQMGVNAIRTAHNPPAKALMDLADEMGFFIVSEILDIWERPKTTFDYARFFTEWIERDVASWVRRDRNHPSLLMWSIGNEIFDTHGGKKGPELTKYLLDLVRQHDPQGNGKLTFGSNYLPWENTQVCAELLEAVGYNYGTAFYQEHHEKYPHWVIYGSETNSVVQSRGIYHFPLEKSILADDDQQCSALGNSPVSWGAKSSEASLDVERETPFSLGQFIWTGFDYLGEPTPYHTKNSYFGQLDTATFAKDSYYVFQAAWTDYRTQPMVHLFPHWDFNPGQVIDVRVASNAPQVALELNGKEIGRQDLREPEYLYVASWKLPYVPGQLRAIAYNEAGEVIASHTRHSFGDATQICLQASQEQVRANGTDLIFVEISMQDAQGRPVENATNRVEVRVSGAGRLVGLDNGDSTDFDQYKGTSRRLFSGKLMAIIAAKLEPGEIRLDVTSPGLAGESAVYQAVPVQASLVQGVSAQLENEEGAPVTGQPGEVPVRKIELVADGSRQLGPEQREVVVKAQLYPENTSYRELEWRVVSDGGIDSPLATLELGQEEVRLQAKGDGQFRLRCLSKNGSDAVRIFSELEFSVDGLGKLYKDPYDFVSAGLYDASVGEVTAGNERGVATARGVETQVGFAELDFGTSGSDSVTFWFFALSEDAYPVQIWEGKPGEEDSVLLMDTIYQKEAKWNVYQTETYKLNKKLTGITTLWIVTQDKMHIKGFSFAEQSRAFIATAATDYQEIYGDNYLVQAQRVEGIGNNVTMDFGEFDFTEQGTGTIVLNGRTPLDTSMVQISFTTPEGEIRRQVEFKQSLDYTSQTFTFAPVSGKAVVRFIFLPGSQFDFAWFQFLQS